MGIMKFEEISLPLLPISVPKMFPGFYVFIYMAGAGPTQNTISLTRCCIYQYRRIGTVSTKLSITEIYKMLFNSLEFESL